MLNIDFSRGELRPAPRHNRPHRRETFYPARCECGYEFWVTGYHADPNRDCMICRNRKAGKASFIASIRKHGLKGAIMGLRQHRLENPSSAESVVIALLDAARVSYERETVFEVSDDEIYLLDFTQGDKALEVNGWSHKLPARAARDQRLKEVWGGALLFVDVNELADPATQEKIIRFFKEAL